MHSSPLAGSGGLPLANDPDGIRVLLVDISMPGMNGFELAACLRRAGSQAALVFLTVHDEQAFVMAAKELGALAYVEKPRLAVDLLHAVREAHAGRPSF